MNSPAFQFYPADFLSDEKVSLMSLAARGAYITLLCYCWREGSIPAEPEKLARLLGVDLDTMTGLMAELLPCFSSAIAQPSRLVNPRLAKEREKQENHRKERQKAGQKGATKRWQKARKKVDTALDSPANILPMAKNSSSSSSSTSINTLSTNVDSDMSSHVKEVFIYWQSKLDHPGAKLTAERRTKITGRLKDGYTIDQIRDGIDGCAASPFHCGENDHGKKYDDIELICRNGTKLENFIEIKKQHQNGVTNGTNKPPVRETANARAARETMALIRGLTSPDSGDNRLDSKDTTPPRLALSPVRG